MTLLHDSAELEVVLVGLRAGQEEGWRPARTLRLVAAPAFVAAASDANASLTGTARAGSVGFALGVVTLTAGVTTLIDHTGRRGMLGDGL